MRTTPSMSTYPVFPDWIFTGTAQVDARSLDIILSETQHIQKEKTHFGFAGHKNSLGPASQTLRKIVGHMFYENAVSHFRLSGHLLNIESTDAQLISIDPGQCVPATVTRLRWYQSAVFLQCDEKSSNLYLDMMDSKLYATPGSVQERMHVIEAEVAKVIFWPAHIPWGFTPNASHRETVILVNNFMIKTPKS
jgi:hypothetical protein